MDVSSTSADDGSALRIPDGTTTQSAICPQCGTKGQWKGAITADMIARTFTRGVNDESGLPNCPRCGTAMRQVTAIDEAAAAAPDRVEPSRQPRIPGLTPPFDFESAFRAIVEKRCLVKAAEKIADRKTDDAKEARKNATDEQEELSALEDDFADRVAELESRPPASARASGCAFEAATGTPCPICNADSPGTTVEEAASEAHVGRVARELATAEELRPTDLVACLERVAAIVLDRSDVEVWTPDQLRDVATWLDLPDKVGFPKVLGRPHVAGPDQHCVNCGCDLRPLAEARGIEAWTLEVRIGTDCRPKGSKKRATRKK